MTPADSDEALMARYAAGEAAAFELLYRRHEMRVWRYLERSVRNRATAEELLQEVWFAVARDAARYRPSARFTTWLFTIAHNRIIDLVRAGRRQPATVGGSDGDDMASLAADPGLNPLARVLAQDRAVALLRAVEELPPDQRECFLLQMEGDLDVAEIAGIMQASFETTKSRLRYARAKLRERLKEYV